MIPQAYLRVYQPLASFSESERAHWERYIVGGGQGRTRQPAYHQHPASGRLGLLAPSESEDADIRLVDGEYFVCPWRTRIRILMSLLELRGSAVPEMADELVPEAEARRAARELARLRRRDPNAVPFMLQSAWHVPIRWFAMFADEERRHVEAPDGDFTVRYETTAVKARRRLDWALEIVRRTDLEPLEEALSDMRRWLSSFEGRSFVELDYARLSRLFGWADLDEDHSAQEVHDAIEALGGGEPARSADLYQAVAERWAEIRSHESLN